MKTMTKAAALAALCTILAGCVRESMDSEEGRVIRFGARTEVSKLTKTTYSGDINAQSVERINWDNGDKIRIYSNEASSPASHYADYDLTRTSKNGIYDYASAAPAGGAAHGLIWGTGTHNFFAVYPAPSTSSVASGDPNLSYSGGNGIVEAILEADQSVSTTKTTEGATGVPAEDYYGNMNLAYMTAATSGSESGGDITLSFTPIVTTFYVSVTNTTGALMTLRKVALSSESNALTGTYRTTFTPANARTYLFEEGGSWVQTPTHSSSNSTIYSAFPNGLSLAAGSTVIVALFAIPKDISELTLTVTSDQTGDVKLPLKRGDGNWLAFTGGNKHNLSNIKVPEVDYDISLTDISGNDITALTYDKLGTSQTFVVTSTKTIGNAVYAAPWKAQIKQNGSWVDMDASNRPSWMSSFPLSSTDQNVSVSTTAPDIGKAVLPRSVDPQVVTSHIERLRRGKILSGDAPAGTPWYPTTEEAAEYASNYEVGTQNNPIDLSYYDFETHRMESSRYTANTYIISAPGWYKFPCVYGNAIEGGNTVENSYKGRLLVLNHLDRFKKMNDFDIATAGPWLELSTLGSNYHNTATLVWEKTTDWDSNNSVAVTSGVNYLQSTSFGAAPYTNVITNVGMINASADGNSSSVSESGQPYVVFYVDPATIRPGNAVIATRESRNTGSTQAPEYKITWSWQIWITDQDMSRIRVHNGTYDYDVLPVNLGWVDDQEGQYYAGRDAEIRFVNVADGVERCTTQGATVSQVELNDDISTSGWQTYYQWGRKDPFTRDATDTQSGDHLLYQSILHPDVMFFEESTEDGTHYYDWSSANYNNLWDSKWNQYGIPGHDLPNHKTVYDPSPRRFCVPPDEAWDGFATTAYGYTGSFSNGYFFNTGTQTGPSTIFFPAAGEIQYGSPNCNETTSEHSYYWTYHAYANTQYRESYALRFSSASVEPICISQTHRGSAFSVRPVAFNRSSSPWSDPSFQSDSYNFYDQWGNNGSTNPVNTWTFPNGDITIRFTNSGTNPNYYYSATASDGYVILHASNSFVVSATGGHKIVEILLSFVQNGSYTISASPINPPSVNYSDGIWMDSSATYDPNTGGTGGETSVTFTLSGYNLIHTNWQLSQVTVYYY